MTDSWQSFRIAPNLPSLLCCVRKFNKSSGRMQIFIFPVKRFQDSFSCDSKVAWLFLQGLVRDGVLEIKKAGRKREKGLRGKATRYKYLLPLDD